LSTSLLKKKITRSLLVSWREQPTRHDIEALQANIRRVGLVIRVRWVLIIVLVTYSVLGGWLYATRMPLAELAGLMWLPALALFLVVLYNTFYALNYRRLGNIAIWNNLQLGLDALVVTVLVYFSGGANSWFWSMYSLFILEAAFIMPRSRDVWLQALGCILLLGGVEWLEFSGLLPHMTIPFASSALHEDAIFVSVRFLWQVTVLAGTAGVATLMVGQFRGEMAERTSQNMLDHATCLYSRSYFMRTFPAELRRSSRDGRQIHLLVLDIDRFGEYNTRFGIEQGDQLLKQVAAEISRVVAVHPDQATSNVVARVGGEEFAVLFVEDEETQAMPTTEEARLLGERIRSAVEGVQVDGAGVTVSVGIASTPDDGSTVEELLDAADVALSCATENGGNRVYSAAECRSERAGEDEQSLPEA
jgi:diguanylate cyclase (GGDEF)-like protein